MRDTTCENFPAGFFAVPLNMRCSRKCAKPDLPGVSSAAPTLYQIMCVTTGARWSGMTTSSNPLARVKCATSVPACSAASEGTIAAESAMSATFVLAVTMLDLAFVASVLQHKRVYAVSHQTTLDRRPSRLTRRLRMCRVVVGRLLRRRLAKTVRLIRRRCLIAGRRFGQRCTRRLAREFRRFFLLVAKHGVPDTAGARAKLGRQQLAAKAGGWRVIPIVGFGRLLFLVFAPPSGSQLIRA